MIIKGISDFVEAETQIWEECLIGISKRKESIFLEFESDYEPEIKIKAIYDSLDEKMQLKLIQLLYGILKRIDVIEENYYSVTSIIGSLELIKPNDFNNTLQELIRIEKFELFNQTNSKINLHIRLLLIYQNLITEDTSILFVRNYYLEKFKNLTFSLHPNFFNAALNFFNKRGEEFFSSLNLLIPIADTKEKKFRLILALDEQSRCVKSYIPIFNWIYIEALKVKKNGETSQCLKDFSYHIIDWIDREIKIGNEDEILLLIKAKAEYISIESFPFETYNLFPQVLNNKSLNLESSSNLFFQSFNIYSYKEYYMNIDRYGNDYLLSFSLGKKGVFSSDPGKHIVIPKNMYKFGIKSFEFHELNV